MDLELFSDRFEHAFPTAYRLRPTRRYERSWYRRWVDRCPSVSGMTAIKNQKLLNLGFACLPPDEAYLEVGTYQGKTLISALHENEPRASYACDNFSEFNQPEGEDVLRANLQSYQLADRVTFFNADFRDVLRPERIPQPVGFYLNDGAHDLDSQYEGIRQAETLLADHALVVVDDWRHAADSGSFAEAGTRKAMQDSPNDWTVLYELPARHNGDLAMWWNGVGVLAFRRKSA